MFVSSSLPLSFRDIPLFCCACLLAEVVPGASTRRFNDLFGSPFAVFKLDLFLSLRLLTVIFKVVRFASVCLFCTACVTPRGFHTVSSLLCKQGFCSCTPKIHHVISRFSLRIIIMVSVTFRTWLVCGLSLSVNVVFCRLFAGSFSFRLPATSLFSRVSSFCR